MDYYITKKIEEEARGQPKIEQDQIRLGRFGIFSFPLQELDRLDAIPGDA